MYKIKKDCNTSLFFFEGYIITSETRSKARNCKKKQVDQSSIESNENP